MPTNRFYIQVYDTDGNNVPNLTIYLEDNSGIQRQATSNSSGLATYSTTDMTVMSITVTGVDSSGGWYLDSMHTVPTVYVGDTGTLWVTDEPPSTPGYYGTVTLTNRTYTGSAQVVAQHSGAASGRYRFGYREQTGISNPGDVPIYGNTTTWGNWNTSLSLTNPAMAGFYQIWIEVDANDPYEAVDPEVVGTVMISYTTGTAPTFNNSSVSATCSPTSASASNAVTTGSFTAATAGHGGTLTYSLVSAKNSGGTSLSGWSVNSSNRTIGIPANTAGGQNYTVVVRVTETKQYYNDSTKDATITVTLNKRTPTLTLTGNPTNCTSTYNSGGTITAGGTKYGTVSASSGTTAVATVSVSGSTVTVTCVKAGSSVITVTSAATNFDNQVQATKTWTINKANGSVGTASNPAAKTFSTSSQTAQLAMTGNTGTVTYPTSITVKDSSNNTVTGWSCTSAGVVTIPASTTVGSYTVTGNVTCAASTNYNAVTTGQSRSWTITINKATGSSGSVSNPAAKTFSTSSQTAQLGITGATGTVTYPTSITVKNSSNTTISGWSCTSAGVVTIPASTTVDTYTVTGNITVAASTNYNAVSATSKTWTITINKATGGVTISNANPTYGTSNNLASVSGATGTMYYRVGTSGSFSTTMPTASGRNAGSYTLYYYVAESTNYTAFGTSSSPKSLSVSVAKASNQISVSPTAVTVYYRTGYTNATVTISNYKGTVTAVSSNTGKITVSPASSTSGTFTVSGAAAGSATVTFTDDGGTNYTSSTVTCSVTCAQDTSYTDSWNNPSITYSYANASAAAGTVSPTISVTQSGTRTYTSGYQQSISNSTFTYSYSMTTGNGFSINTSTGVITVEARGKYTTTRTSNTATVTVTGSGSKSNTATATCTQNGNTYTDSWNNPSVTTYSYGNIGAAGGTSSPSVTASQSGTRTWANSAGTDTLSNSSFTYGYSMTTGNGFSINTTSGVITAEARGKYATTRTSNTATVTVTGNGKSGTKTATCTQAANTYTDSWNNPSVTAYTYASITAAGGTSSPSVTASQSGTRTWANSAGTDTLSNSTFTYAYSMTSGSGFSINTSTGVITVDGRGTTIGNARTSNTATVTVTGNGKSGTKTATLTQPGNYVTAITPKSSSNTDGAHFSYANIGAGATSASPSLSGGALYTFSSGSTEFSSSGSPSFGGSVSYSRTYTLASSQNGFTAVNSSGVLTATNRAKNTGAARTSATVTSVLTVTYTHASSYSGGGTVTSSTKSSTATCTQNANYLTWGDVTLTVSSPATPYAMAVSGETKAISASGGTQTGTYSSGSSDTFSPTLSYTVKTAKDGYSLINTNQVKVTNNNTSSARNGFVVTVTASGKTGTNSTYESGYNKTSSSDRTFNQAAGSKVYETPTVSAFSYDTFAAAGATKSPTVTYSQVWTWNGVSGSGGTITSGGTLAFTTTGTLPTDFSTGSNYSTTGSCTWANNTTTSTRDAKDNLLVAVTLNSKTSSTLTCSSCLQSAGAKVYANPTVTQYTYSTFAAKGVSNRYPTVTYTQTWTWNGTGTTTTDSYTYNSSNTDPGGTRAFTASGTLPDGFSTGTSFATSGRVTWANRTTVEGAARNAKSNLSVTVTVNGKTSAAYTCTACSQSANAVTGIVLTVSENPIAYGNSTTATVTATYTSTSTADRTADTTFSTSPDDIVTIT